MNSTNNKRIVKNTALLYFRMLITMAVSLYTSRVVLNTLGVEDFGIYNVVGGFVIMFGFLNSAMSRATQRFLAFEIGRDNLNQIRNVFSMSVNIHLLISFVIFVLAETVGLWFIKTQLNIPAERIVAANWVYHFSILALIMNILTVPFNAIIVAYERMNVFAWVSIIEVSLKLIIVFLLTWFGFDKLKFYSFLMFIVSVIIALIYLIYCNLRFNESKFRYFWDKKMFQNLLSFAGWSLWGSLASVLASQGINILLNVFFGPALNAARGIAFQIRGAVASFAMNFQVAVSPQIIKSFANNDLKYMHQLIFKSAKYSFFLLFILSLPILLETSTILKIWLKIVPEYTIIFTQLIIINILIESFFEPLNTAAHATGKIKLFQTVISGILLLTLPFSYVFLKLGYSPEITFSVNIFFSICTLISRLIILNKIIHLKVIDFVNHVIFRSFIVLIVAIVIPLTIHLSLSESLYRFVLVSMVSIICSIITIYFIGLNQNEKKYIADVLQKMLLKIKA